MNNIINDKKGHNIVNDSFAHKPDGLLVTTCFENVSTARHGVFLVTILFLDLVTIHWIQQNLLGKTPLFLVLTLEDILWLKFLT